MKKQKTTINISDVKKIMIDPPAPIPYTGENVISIQVITEAGIFELNCYSYKKIKEIKA